MSRVKAWGKGLVLGVWMGSSQAWAFCWEEAASRHDLEPELLQAIASVESGYRAQAMNYTNRNGTRDIGLMQINSIHLPRLLKQGITEERLLSEPCLSVEVGASILAECTQILLAITGRRWGLTTWGRGPGHSVRHYACATPKGSGCVMRR